MTIEEEFKMYSFFHKIKVLQMAIERYYIDLQQSEVNIPYFMDKDEDIKEKTLNYIIDLLDNRENFEYLYKLAWDKFSAEIS